MKVDKTTSPRSADILAHACQPRLRKAESGQVLAKSLALFISAKARRPMDEILVSLQERPLEQEAC